MVQKAVVSHYTRGTGAAGLFVGDYARYKNYLMKGSGVHAQYPANTYSSEV